MQQFSSYPNLFHTKKHLGQHLLINRQIIDNIIAVANSIHPLNKTTVIEVGPGTGNLTKHLLAEHALVFAIEKDTSTTSFLNDLKMKYPDTFRYILRDALTVNLLEIAQDLSKEHKPSIIANLPYNIGTQLFTNWLGNSHHFSYFLLMFQKEVALRICSNTGDKNYGRLSLYTQYFGEAKLLFEVDKDSFSPPPKVDSGVILFTPHSVLPKVNLKLFESITLAAFATRRKMVRQSLKQFNFDFAALEIKETARAEELTFADYTRLTNYLEQNSTKKSI